MVVSDIRGEYDGKLSVKRRTLLMIQGLPICWFVILEHVFSAGCVRRLDCHERLPRILPRPYIRKCHLLRFAASPVCVVFPINTVSFNLAEVWDVFTVQNAWTASSCGFPHFKPSEFCSNPESSKVREKYVAFIFTFMQSSFCPLSTRNSSLRSRIIFRRCPPRLVFISYIRTDSENCPGTTTTTSWRATSSWSIIM